MHSILEIDTNIIQHNFNVLKSRLGSSKASIVLKADAYGFGMEQLAPLFKQWGCNEFYVAYLEEGVKLRQILGYECDIYVLNGLFKDTEKEFFNYKLIPVIFCLENWYRWKMFAHKMGKILPVILHFDTGMNRVSLEKDEVELILEDTQNVNIRYLMSHLACANDLQHPANLFQLKKFQEISQYFQEVPKSFANSHGVFIDKNYYFDQVRLGVELYGLYGHVKAIKTCFHLWSKIIEIRRIDPPNFLGYGFTYEINRPSMIATVAFGYCDGMPKALSNKGFVKINGYKAPIVGNVSMDLFFVDITDLPINEINQDTWCLILGEDITFKTWESWDAGFHNEFMFHIGPRVRRIYT